MGFLGGVVLFNILIKSLRYRDTDYLIKLAGNTKLQVPQRAGLEFKIILKQIGEMA